MGESAELTRLMLKYLGKRVAAGELSRDSAAKVRSRLLSFASTTTAAPDRITRRHVEQWLGEPGLSAHYRRARLSALRCFFRWCLIERHVKRDPTLGITPAKLPPLLPRAFSHDESRRLVHAAADDVRTEAAVLLMLQEGLRRIEVSRLQIGDIDRRKQTIAVRGKGGQGGITAHLPLSDETWTILTRYLAVEVQATSGPVFRSRINHDKPLSASRIGELVLNAIREAGLKQYNGDGKSAHACRHTCAQDLIDAGVDIRQVQKVLRHASIRNTELYTRGEVKGLREAMKGRVYRGGDPGQGSLFG